uniref:Uncharacterized protein n=1 Tax=Lepeophtheirus salmonis TaxID=72036 RepID=A0A0K2V4K1_LEPSM
MVSTYLFTYLQWVVIHNFLRIRIIYSCYFSIRKLFEVMVDLKVVLI